MSAKALQRVVTRMLFDGQFADAVYADPAGALEGLGIDPAHYGTLTAPDPRRWRADPMRRFRALSALLEEFPVSGAFWARQVDGLARLNGFFSAAAFHDCVQGRGSMALSFGEWLRVEHAAITDIVDLETAIARVRRPRPAQPGVGLAAGVAVCAVRENTLERWSAARGDLARHPEGVVAAVVDVAWPLPLPTASAEAAVLAVETGPEGPVVGDVTGALGTFLRQLSAGPVAHATAVEWLHSADVPIVECAEIIEDLCCQGLVSQA